MPDAGALVGLHVLDLTDESGRFAGKVLAEAGADVVRLRPGVPGAAMRGSAGERGGVLDWWFDGGTRHLSLDLESAADREQVKQLAARADLLIETERPGRLAALRLDYADLQPINPSLVQVSLTPFGRTGPRSGWQVSDLVSAALGGVLSVNGEPDRPLNGWGRQAFSVGGLYAAIAGLAGVVAARVSGRGQLIDLSLHEAVISCTEQVLMGWFYRDLLPGVQREEPFGVYRRQQALHWTGAYDVLPCANGHVMVTLVPGTVALVGWLAQVGMKEVVADIATGAAQLTERIPELMAALQALAADKDAHEFFLEGQQKKLAWGEVLSVAEAAKTPQLQTRGSFRSAAWDGPPIEIPGPLFRPLGTPAPLPAPPAAPASAETVQAAWSARKNPVAATVSGGKPLAGLRVLDFTWVLAGPFATRILADLGADVVKVQTEERSQGTNGAEHPYHAMWNRGKRSIALNMKHPRATEIFRQLAEKADVVVENFSAGVLDRWGIGYEAAQAWNERLIYIGMSGPGRDGPWRDFVTYAPTIHALSGLTHLTGLPGRDDIGYGMSYNDHASGLAGALAALEALEARRSTGRGQFIDLSQLEVGAYLLGPAFIDFLNNGVEAQPAGNRDPFEDFVPNEVYRCSNDEWLAITARDDREWRLLCDAVGDQQLTENQALATVAGRRGQRDLVDRHIGVWAAKQDATQAMRRLQAAGVPAGMVQDARDMTSRDEQLAAREWLTETESPVQGRRSTDRFPARFENTPLGPYTAAPSYGEHTFDIYHELLGLSDEQIAEGISEGLFT